MSKSNYGVFTLFKRQFKSGKAVKRTEPSLSMIFHHFKIHLEYFSKKKTILNAGMLANFKGQYPKNLIRNRLSRIIIIKRLETHQLYICKLDT